MTSLLVCFSMMKYKPKNHAVNYICTRLQTTQLALFLQPAKQQVRFQFLTSFFIKLHPNFMAYTISFHKKQPNNMNLQGQFQEKAPKHSGCNFVKRTTLYSFQPEFFYWNASYFSVSMTIKKSQIKKNFLSDFFYCFSYSVIISLPEYFFYSVQQHRNKTRILFGYL